MCVESLGRLRAEIRARDEDITRLLNERARLSRAIGRIKALRGLKVYDPEQEHQVYASLHRLRREPLPQEGLRRIYAEILSVSRSLQGGVTVAYLQTAGKTTATTIRALFGPGTRPVVQARLGDLLANVAAGGAECGVCAIPEALGPIDPESVEQLFATPLSIQRECHVRLPARGGRRGAVTRPRAAGADRTDEGGVLSPPRPAWVRCLCWGQGPAVPTGDDRTSLLLGTQREVQTLRRALQLLGRQSFAFHKVGIQPRPSGADERVFWVDFNGHQADAPTRARLDALAKVSTRLKVLGSYAKGGHPS